MDLSAREVVILTDLVVCLAGAGPKQADAP
jgi:hypothetical protein